MTTCIVSEFPWAAIADVTTCEKPGVIVCTDTRVTTTKGGEIVGGTWAKQQQIANNIVVCYTSNNLGATASALSEVLNVRKVASIGVALKAHHRLQGGFTELIAIVWRGDRTPQVLELMPPNYEPKHRSGVVGIGDTDVLRSFREQFFEEPRPDLIQPVSKEALARMAQVFGVPVGLPRYSIDDAATNVGQALVEAIRLCRKPTVEVPVQLTCISGQHVTYSRMVLSPDIGKTWTQVTSGPHEVRIPLPTTAVTSTHVGPRTAVQLFS